MCELHLGKIVRDCGRCNCALSGAQHTSATDQKTGMSYCTICHEWI